jgi:hypothetical protein
VKKFFRKIKKKLSPLVLIPVVLVLVLVLVGGYFLFFAGDDDDGDSTETVSTTAGPGGGGGSGDETKTLTKPKPPKINEGPPAGKEFTIDSDRDEKDYAIAQASGAVKSPQRIAVRIGAAPKQPVAVNVSVTCTQTNEAAKTNLATFNVTPPHTRDLKLPVDEPVSCTATANAQLTQAGKGRIKVFLIATRRAGS